MAIHDAYARLTPYELLLPDPGFPDRLFPEIGAEAGERGTDVANPAAFTMLGTVQGALAELRSEHAEPESAHDHGGVLYFAYHMWLAGPAVTLVRAGTLRGLLASDPVEARTGGPGADTTELRERAGYVQLPQHLVWIEEGDAGEPGRPSSREPAEPHPHEPAGNDPRPPGPIPAPESGSVPPPESGSPPSPEPGSTPVPESVDGFFWAGDRGGILHLALVTGMRGDRPGYGVVPVPPQPLASLPGWAAGSVREGGGDFTTSLPGAELDGLLGICTPAEVFKLAALVLGRVQSAEPPPAPAASAEPPPGPQPTALPYLTL